MRYDEDAGRYVGDRLTVDEFAVLRRIRQVTATALQRGVDPSLAGDEAWLAALDESAWSLGDAGVEARYTGSR